MIPKRRGADSNTPASVVNMVATELRRSWNHEPSSNDPFAKHEDANGDQPMSKHVAISPGEAADRLSIRELLEAYAHCADRRDAKGQMSLFTAETHFVVYMNAKDATPSQELHSREALAPVFAELKQYEATTHFLGQSTIFTLTSDRAAGEAYCLAHHVALEGGKQR